MLDYDPILTDWPKKIEHMDTYGMEHYIHGIYLIYLILSIWLYNIAKYIAITYPHPYPLSRGLCIAVAIKWMAIKPH